MADERKEFDEYKLTISSKEEMKIHIHDIHNYLRNNGAGYGMNALKLFTLFYGLAKIEYNGHFEKTELPDSCRFSEIKQKFDDDFQENVYVFINETVLKYIYIGNEKIKFMLWYKIPEHIRSEVIKELVNKISELVELEEELGFQLAGKIYEYFIGRDRNAISELGAYFTDRHITDYIYNNVLDLELNEDGSVKTMIDPFGGSGGFTLSYIMHLQEEYPEINWSEELCKVYHYDMNLDVVKYAMLEMYCLTGEFSNEEQLRTINSFSNDFSNQRFDYILTNPPYGGDKIVKTESVENMELIKSRCEEFLKEKYNITNLKSLREDMIDDLDMNKLKQYNYIVKKLKDIKKENDRKIVSLNNSAERFKIYADNNGINKLKCKDKESVSFLMMMELLEEGGTAIGVLKEGVFFDKKYKELRQHCAENFNIEKIISIDSSQFENTSTKTSIIKFSNTGRTDKIRFYDLIIHKDERTEIEEDETGEFRITTIKDRINNITDEFVAEATFEDLESNDFSFNYKLYNVQELIINNNYEFVKLGDICNINRGERIKNDNIEKEKKEDYIYPVYGAGKLQGYTKTYNREGKNCILVRVGSRKSINCAKIIDTQFFLTDAGFTITIKNQTNENKDYIYNFLVKSYDCIFTKQGNGSVQVTISGDFLNNLQIPIPKNEQLTNYWTTRINQPYNLLNDSKTELEELEQTIKISIEQLLDNNEIEEVELGDLCEFNYGTRITKNNNITGIYPVYGGGDITFYTNTFNRENKTLVLSRYALSNNCIRIIYNRFFLNDSGMSITSDINNYLGYYLKLNEYLIINTCTRGSIQKNIDMDLIRNFIVKLPINRNLINELNPLFDRVDELNDIISENERLYHQYLDELRDDIFNN